MKNVFVFQTDITNAMLLKVHLYSLVLYKYQNIQTNALDAQNFREQHLILLQFRNQQNRRKSMDFVVMNELLILKPKKPLNYSI